MQGCTRPVVLRQARQPATTPPAGGAHGALLDGDLGFLVPRVCFDVFASRRPRTLSSRTCPDASAALGSLGRWHSPPSPCRSASPRCANPGTPALLVSRHNDKGI